MSNCWLSRGSEQPRRLEIFASLIVLVAEVGVGCLSVTRKYLSNNMIRVVNLCYLNWGRSPFHPLILSGAHVFDSVSLFLLVPLRVMILRLGHTWESRGDIFWKQQILGPHPLFLRGVAGHLDLSNLPSKDWEPLFGKHIGQVSADISYCFWGALVSVFFILFMFENKK